MVRERKRSGADRKSGEAERERSGERRSQKTMDCERSVGLRSGNGAESGVLEMS